MQETPVRFLGQEDLLDAQEPKCLAGGDSVLLKATTLAWRHLHRGLAHSWPQYSLSGEWMKSICPHGRAGPGHRARRSCPEAWPPGPGPCLGTLLSQRCSGQHTRASSPRVLSKGPLQVLGRPSFTLGPHRSACPVFLKNQRVCLGHWMNPGYPVSQTALFSVLLGDGAALSSSSLGTCHLPGLLGGGHGWEGVQKHQFFGAQPSSQSNSHIHTWPQEKP